MARVWARAKFSPKVRKVFLELMRQGALRTSLEIGQLSRDGRLALIGSWVLGSMSESHYGDEDTLHEALLIIAEQQPDGSFKFVTGSGSMAEDGCAYFDHADIDLNGTDEILLECDALEGSYVYGVIKRKKSKWQLTFTGLRN